MTNQNTPKKQIKIQPHKSSFATISGANKYLVLADNFLEKHPDILYWTEKNSTKKGLFYYYTEGLYSIVSTLEIEQMLIDYIPEDKSVVIPCNLSHAKQMETMINIMRRRFFYRECFNPEGIINFRNGFFNVSGGDLSPHTMDIISTNQLPYNYDKQAKCENFMKALNDATGRDLYKISIIQEFAGYCLTRDTKLEKVLFLIGAAGSGKSSVLEGLETMLGKENVSHTSMDQLCQPRYAGNFIDKIANIDTEIPKDIKGYESVLNKIVSGESVKVDTKFIPSYDARPYCKLIFAANDMPNIGDTSDSVFRRMLLIYFNNVISKEKIDMELKNKIRSEGAGIFNWAFEGMNRLIGRRKFTESIEMTADIEELKMQNNAIYYFINENYDVGLEEKEYIPITNIHDTYIKFCHSIKAKGVYKKPIFGKEVLKVFNKKVRKAQKRIGGVNCRVLTGIRAKDTYSKSNEEINWND